MLSGTSCLSTRLPTTRRCSHIKLFLQHKENYANARGTARIFFLPRTNLCSHFPDYSLASTERDNKEHNPKTSICPGPFGSNARCVFCRMQSQRRSGAGQEGGEAGMRCKCRRWDFQASLRPFSLGRSLQEALPCRERLWEGFQPSVSTCPAHARHQEKAPRPVGAAQGPGSHNPSNSPWDLSVPPANSSSHPWHFRVCIPKGWLWAKRKALAFHTGFNISTLF